MQYICERAIPCIWETVKTWHDSEAKRQQPCQSPQQCITKGKPKTGKSCQACVDWGSSIDKVFYKRQQNAEVTWRNVNPTRLHNDPIEVMKAFVLRLVPGKTYTGPGDFDVACLLMIMMFFAKFHGSNPQVHDTIKKVR